MVGGRRGRGRGRVREPERTLSRYQTGPGDRRNEMGESVTGRLRTGPTLPRLGSETSSNEVSTRCILFTEVRVPRSVG